MHLFKNGLGVHLHLHQRVYQMSMKAISLGGQARAQMLEEYDFSDYAAYINAEVLLPQNGKHMCAA